MGLSLKAYYEPVKGPKVSRSTVNISTFSFKWKTSAFYKEHVHLRKKKKKTHFLVSSAVPSSLMWWIRPTAWSIEGDNSILVVINVLYCIPSKQILEWDWHG